MSHVEVRRAIEQRPCDVCGYPILRGDLYHHALSQGRVVNVHIECPEEVKCIGPQR